MKTLFFTIPIVFITNNIYKWIYGNYDFYFSLDYFGKTLKQNAEGYTVSFVVFSFIFVIFYAFETYMIPNWLMSYDGMLNVDSFTMKIISNKIKNRIGYVPISKSNKKRIGKIELLSFIRKQYIRLMYYPMTSILWIIALNNVFVYPLIILSIYSMFLIAKSINTFYK